MKVLVLGASGHIGNAILRAFLDRGCDVTACSRRSARPANLLGLPVNFQSGNSDTRGQLHEWVAGHDIVVDAAAPYPLDVFSPVDRSETEPIAYAERRTRRLLEAVARHQALLLYVSSFVTLAHPRTPAQKMQAQLLRLAHPYFDVKELIEAQILASRRDGVRAVIINPTYCLGPWDLHERRICTIPLLLAGEIPSSITQLLNVIDVRDVAAGALAAMDAQRYGSPLLLSGHDISTHELYRLICEIGGVQAPRYSAPAPLALTGAYLMELALGVIGQKTLLPSGGMMMATAFDYLDRRTVPRDLSVTPRPLIETLADAITWYRRIGYC
jgi:dihydroflavonol-4-reductase